MQEKSTASSRIKLDIVALTLLVTAEICFYRIGTLNLYFIMTGFGIVVGLFIAGIRYIHRSVNIRRFPVWLIVIYGMFVINGFFRLQIGTFTWDTIFYRFIENLAMYYLFRDIVRENSKKIVGPFLIAGLFSFGYLLMTEGTSFLAGYSRIGNLMSGNVNTVGYNFGLVSMFTMWWYCQEKKWYKLVLFLLFSIVMLLTGSKKVVIILLLDFVLLFMHDRGHAGRWLKFGLAFVALVYLVFNVPVFYEIIGHRIETMISTMLYGNNTALYSYSTDVRNRMIEEGFKLFLKKPIFGGGWAYFYANTTTSYTYSHNNYIELLCSFGLVGTLIYYNKHIATLLFSLKSLIKSHFNDRRFYFPFILILATVLLDFAAISFSAVCVWYIPLICSCVMVEDIKYNIPSKNMRK
jgi:O-antigen ligase